MRHLPWRAAGQPARPGPEWRRRMAKRADPWRKGLAQMYVSSASSSGAESDTTGPSASVGSTMPTTNLCGPRVAARVGRSCDNGVAARGDAREGEPCLVDGKRHTVDLEHAARHRHIVVGRELQRDRLIRDNGTSRRSDGDDRSAGHLQARFVDFSRDLECCRSSSAMRSLPRCQ